MKRVLLAITLLFASVSVTNAQISAVAFSRGTNVIEAGVGIGGYYNYFTADYSQSPPIMLTYENSIVDPFGSGMLGLGGQVSYQSSNTSWNDIYNYSDKYTFELVAVRSAYHIKSRIVPKLDMYAGITVGYLFYQHIFNTNDPNPDRPSSPGYSAYSGLGAETHFQYGGYAGARYYFGNTFGVHLEIVIMNNGYNYIGVGLSIRLQ
ncbi:MAG TPA: hypothetical protein VK806_10890 [Bacteroidia bacterium]|jgi:hypothetical protein|nr:hypothetical protein [Bacteroidia bacterium]